MKKLLIIFFTFFIASHAIGESVVCIMVDNVWYPITDEKKNIVSYAHPSKIVSQTVSNGPINVTTTTYQPNYNYKGSLTIPSTVKYNGKTYFVTGIAKWALSDFINLTSVTIPNSVTSIGKGSFDGCRSLTSITIPNSVTSIGEYAFDGCRSLKSITIPNGITRIEYSTFYGCSSLTSVTIPNSVTSIGEDAFNGCSSLTSITIPNSVTSIGDNAFCGCNNLTSVSFPESLDVSRANISFIKDGIKYHILNGKEVEVVALHSGKYSGDVVIPATIEMEGRTFSVINVSDYAFRDCSSLTSVTIPNSVTSIGSYAFAGCSSLTSITIPNSVTNIPPYAFKDCSSLTSVTIPNTVTNIGKNAFSGCSNLTSVMIPNSVTQIGYAAFYNCSNLSSVQISDAVTTIDDYTFFGCNSLTSIIIPNSVTNIGYAAFAKCSNLSSVLIPESVTNIEDYAFSGCTSLTSVELPESVIGIGTGAFELEFEKDGIRYERLNNKEVRVVYNKNNVYTGDIIIPATVNTLIVTSIADEAFRNCNLNSITIPESIINIGTDAFWGCSPQKLMIHDIESWLNITFADAESNPLTSKTQLYIDGGKVTKLTIPESVTNIGDYAFANFQDLTSVTIPRSVTNIETRAFYGCENLKEVINYSPLDITKSSPMNGFVAFYADYVIDTIIGDFLFNKSEKTLVKYIGNGGDVILPETLTDSCYAIGDNAFYACNNLTSVFIPDSVTEIGNGAFSKCSGLTTVAVGNSVVSVGNDAFFGCYKLTSFTADDSLAYVGYAAFSGCQSLTSVVIPNAISIGDYAFSGCENLTSIVIPDTLDMSNTDLYFTQDNIQYNVRNGKEVVLCFFSDKKRKGDFVIPEPVVAGNKFSVISIKDNAFSGCSGLTSVTISDFVTAIGDDAFAGCSNLSSVSFGKSVTNIGKWAFANDKSIKTVICYAPKPPQMLLDAFDNYSAHLYVPCEYSNTYSFDLYWSHFNTISCVESIETEIVSHKTDDVFNVYVVGKQIFINDVVPAFVINSNGQKIANTNLCAGVYFVLVGDTWQRIVISR